MKPDNDTNWQYKSDGASNQYAATAAAPAPSGTQKPPPSSTVSWTASEYVDHPHGAGWYLMLMLATGVVAAGVYFITKDWLALSAIVALGFVVGIFAIRKPRQITYEILSNGFRVGEKTYSYNQFKSFGVTREGSLSSVNLQPLKKLMPPISAYFAAEDEQHIVDALGEYLPYGETKVDRIDRFTQRLRF